MVENNEAIDSAIDKMREEPKSTGETLKDMSLFEWLPYLDMVAPHPLDPKKDEKLGGVQEIYDYFSKLSPKDPFNAFKFSLTNFAPLLVGETKLDRVLRYIRLIKLKDKEYGRQ